VVLTEDAQRFADQMGIQLFETSAKDNLNVEEMFLAVTRMVLRTKKHQRERQQQTADKDGHIKLGGASRGPKNKNRSKCC